MKYVIDSSVAFKWVVPEPDSDKADRLREDFRNAVHELIAPGVFPVEVGHALTRAERQRRISVGSAVPSCSTSSARRRPSMCICPCSCGPVPSPPRRASAFTTACTWLWPNGRVAKLSRRTAG